MIIIGLTGSIGMGKSTVAKQFESLGVPIHDADAQVHEFFDPSHAVYQEIAAAFPEAEYPQIYNNGVLERKNLGRIVFANDYDRKRLELIIHPQVRIAQDAFKAAQKEQGTDIVLLDIPLLFETAAHARVDKIIVVTAPKDVQAERVLARPNMTQDKFESILASQMDNAEKCKRADFIIRTDAGLDDSLAQCKDILADLKKH